MSATRIPKVGDTVLLEGLPRTITEIVGPTGRTVLFDNPPDVPHYVFAREKDGTVRRDAHGNKVVESGFPSRAGAVGMSNLDLIIAEPVPIWGVRGRVEARQPNPDAVQLQPAEYNINKPRAKSKAKAAKKGAR